MARTRPTIVLSAVLAATVLMHNGSNAQPSAPLYMPPYMKVIVAATVPTPAAAAKQNVLALKTGMFELYGEAGQLVQGSILAQHPVIPGLFSGAGGRPCRSARTNGRCW